MFRDHQRSCRKPKLPTNHWSHSTVLSDDFYFAIILFLFQAFSHHAHTHFFPTQLTPTTPLFLISHQTNLSVGAFVSSPPEILPKSYNFSNAFNLFVEIPQPTFNFYHCCICLFLAEITAFVTFSVEFNHSSS
ncbi:hypothetical protein L1987_55206 [Smallanthus sonchifolius]|uniref:Uncharacterized protein n=1 Tax=Smallanthus sonchifolius TaxID=185202 RepID=A0ACB9E8S1_9ASTR|nr:hypothetical protein L1987_55206 [Smallanthus sonchifolius]